VAKIKFSQGAGDSGKVSGSGETTEKKSEVTAQVVEELKKKYGFDKPLWKRYVMWLGNIVTLEFGYSHTFGRPVVDLIASKFPVSVRFGVSSLLITYIVCIPLGIFKALRNGYLFDKVSSFVIFLLYSIFPFMLAIILIKVFSVHLEWLPMGGIKTLDSDSWPWQKQLWDQGKHMVLPLICFVVNDFAVLTVLMKNSLLEEVAKDYVRTARAKGVSEWNVIAKHILRNALIPIATGIGGVIAVLFTSNLLIERIFNLDGFGKLFYDAALQRDYPVLMAQVVFVTILGLVGQLISDVIYVLIDPRIDFGGN